MSLKSDPKTIPDNRIFQFECEEGKKFKLGVCHDNTIQWAQFVYVSDEKISYQFNVEVAEKGLTSTKSFYGKKILSSRTISNMYIPPKRNIVLWLMRLSCFSYNLKFQFVQQVYHDSHSNVGIAVYYMSRDVKTITECIRLFQYTKAIDCQDGLDYLKLDNEFDRIIATYNKYRTKDQEQEYCYWRYYSKSCECLYYSLIHVVESFERILLSIPVSYVTLGNELLSLHTLVRKDYFSTVLQLVLGPKRLLELQQHVIFLGLLDSPIIENMSSEVVLSTMHKNDNVLFHETCLVTILPTPLLSLIHSYTSVYSSLFLLYLRSRRLQSLHVESKHVKSKQVETSIYSSCSIPIITDNMTSVIHHITQQLPEHDLTLVLESILATGQERLVVIKNTWCLIKRDVQDMDKLDVETWIKYNSLSGTSIQSATAVLSTLQLLKYNRGTDTIRSPPIFECIQMIAKKIFEDKWKDNLLVSNIEMKTINRAIFDMFVANPLQIRELLGCESIKLAARLWIFVTRRDSSIDFKLIPWNQVWQSIVFMNSFSNECIPYQFL